MTTLYMAWQSPRSRRWYPVGRLVRQETEPAEYEFAYLQGAEQAKDEAGFFMAPGFARFNHAYTAPVIFFRFWQPDHESGPPGPARVPGDARHGP